MWDWIKLNIFQMAATQPGGMGAMAGAVSSIVRETEPDIPPTIGEMSVSFAEEVGKGLSKVWVWIKWGIVIILFILLLWLFIGRKG